MLIRNERPGDEDAIHSLTVVAFEPMAFSDGSEAPIIRSLRKSGDLTLSLVAEEGGAIIGHIAFSPVTIDGTHFNWFGLGPVSVQPEMQRQGIGKALILTGLEMLKERGAHGCALIGNPEIYSRVGFESDGRLSYGNLDSSYVQRLVLAGPAPQGELKFAPAFEAEGHAG
ncbi:GNAT family N-acetyltransferase [Chelativorans alearense]|uniref:GNAT family N-acetyltransferase n=1 Tax=Chelativorans alearense TaxID=2681495 RepID=UPI0013CF90E3|nr:N-acetyltransferase [Chelativorans alearense]